MGSIPAPALTRADELDELLGLIQPEIHRFIAAADEDAATKSSGQSKQLDGSSAPRTTLVDIQPPEALKQLLKLNLPEEAGGKGSVLDVVRKTLQYSVNTWDQGFMDKLYASTDAVGVVSELLLATLNTNVHVYQVSPVLTLVEKHVGKQLASLYGFDLPTSGAVSQPGGSASNQSSIIIARNIKFPDTKRDGNGSYRFVIFTSAHGHYSMEKAAQIMGLGSRAVVSVPVDEEGRMKPIELARLVSKTREDGFTPFYVNATAGTTVLGSFDPFHDIADICAKENLWLHVDGCVGGSVVFSEELRKGRLDGIERADSIAVNPHKMMGVPLTCSFLVGKDIRQFHAAMRLRAGYLFHTDGEDPEIYDMAELVPQCGRRGDSLKLFLGWTYYGRQGYARMIENGFKMAEYLLELLKASPNVVVISKLPLPCTQVCFQWARNGQLSVDTQETDKETAVIAQKLILRGFMVDYAPGEKGMFLRAVVGKETRKETIEGFVRAIEAIGNEL